jgi:uncharacterized membrane protein (UPF0182 family)
VRYPEDLFKVQRKLLASYHVSDPVAFYSQQDFWTVPADPTKNDGKSDQPPYYLTLKMPDSEKAAFSLTSTFTPRGRPQLSAFMSVNSDPGPDYGKIRILELPRSTTIGGPGQVQNQFEADTKVQEKLNVLRIGGGGSRIEYGNLLTLPVGGGLLYVEPVYIRASGGESYPLLQKVLVSFGDKIAFEDTFEKGLAALFGPASTPPPSSGDPGTTPPPTTPPPSGEPVPGDLAKALADMKAAFDEGQEALKAGDFAAYGKAQEKLSAAIEAALAAQEKAGSSGGSSTPPPSPSASPSPGG